MKTKLVRLELEVVEKNVYRSYRCVHQHCGSTTTRNLKSVLIRTSVKEALLEVHQQNLGSNYFAYFALSPIKEIKKNKFKFFLKIQGPYQTS